MQGTSLILSLALARWQKYSVCFCPGDPLVTSTSNLERLPHIPLSFLPVAITNGTQFFYQPFQPCSGIYTWLLRIERQIVTAS